MDTDRDREGWFWIITGALVVLVVGALRALGGPSPVSNSTQNPQAASPASVPARAEVSQRSSRASREGPADTPIATVFECRLNGQRIYSDQRCGSNADEHVIVAPNRMDPQNTGILLSPDEVLARSRSGAAPAREPDWDGARSECVSIEQQKDSINARMREGYTSPEGEWFRARLRALGTRYYELRCRHFR